MLEHQVVDGCAVVTIRRVDAGNSVNDELVSALQDLVTDLAHDPPCAVVLTGQGERFFSTGADVKYLSALSTDDVGTFTSRVRCLLERWEGLPMLTCAAINGMALGGGAELALACDYRIADPAATFGLPQVHLGIMPGWDGIWRLTRLVGHRVARDLVLSGRMIGAQEAAALHVVDAVSTPTRLVDEARGLLADITDTGSIESRAVIKQELLHSSAASDGGEQSLSHFLRLWDSDAHADAVQRFRARK